MGIEAEVEVLRRQNRRLKVALFSTIAVLLMAGILIIGMAGVAGFAATRARAQAIHAMERERLARAQAEAAYAKAQQALEENEAVEEQPVNP